LIKINAKTEIAIYLLIWFGFILIIYLQYKSWEEQRYLDIVPYGLNVSKVIYVSEESWGDGPGGNETGVIVYQLSDQVANEIQKVGVAIFSKNTGGFSDFRNWKQTPIYTWEEAISREEPELSHRLNKIAHYLNSYGFPISIDLQIESEIDNAITKAGSYYAYSRTGIIIVLPINKKVVYAYAG